MSIAAKLIESKLLPSWKQSLNLLRKSLAGRLIRRRGGFDAAWYRERYPDIGAAGLDPLQHYLEFGHLEGRDPNPIFDSKWYRAEYCDLIGAEDNPLADYLRAGGSGARRPNRFFDPAWYRSHYLGGRTRVDPMVHFLEEGAALGCDPAPGFDIRAFAARYPGSGLLRNPLANFLESYLVVGCIDRCTSFHVSGWAGRRIGPPIELTIVVNDIAFGHFTPWISRPDVTASLGIEASGFSFVFPEPLGPGDVVELFDEFDRDICAAPTIYSVLPLGAPGDLRATRASIAAAFLAGRGVEIGALNQPTDVPKACDVIYYDRFPAPVLRTFYDDREIDPLFEPDILGNAENLDGLEGETFDFIIANHVIEHLEDPIAFLKSVTSHLNIGGHAMIAAPDKRHTFDVARPITPFRHLVADHCHGVHHTRREHRLEYARLVEHIAETDLEARLAEFDRENMHPIHYHVWDADHFIGFVEDAIAMFGLPLKLVYETAANGETIVVLERIAPRS
jgi:SAM-dependent methyltransferase